VLWKATETVPSGPALPALFPGCGPDPTPDELACERSRSCGGLAESGFVARLESVTVMPLDESDLASLDTLAQEDLAFMGLVFDVSVSLRVPLW
jgi:hypothetical protein